MASKAQLKAIRLISNRTDLVKYLRELTSDIESGDTLAVMSFINGGTVKTDVETILGRTISKDEGTCLLHSPGTVGDNAFRRAHAIAWSFRECRAMARRMMSRNRVEGLIPSIVELVAQLEACAL